MLRVIDTETCDLQGGIVEVASVDVIDGKIVNPMSHLVRPDRPISRGLKRSSLFTTVASGMWPITPALTAACCRRCPANGFAL